MHFDSPSQAKVILLYIPCLLGTQLPYVKLPVDFHQ
jgi:hypothetical protein